MEFDRTEVARFAERLKEKGKLPSTIESYCRDACRFIDYLTERKISADSLSPETLLDYQSYLVDDRKGRENSIRRNIIGIRQFFRFLSEEHKIPATPFDSVPIPERNEVLPSGLSAQNIEQLIATALSSSSRLKGCRDASLLRLLAHEGLKASEVIAAQWADFLANNGIYSLHVRGTRNRTVELSLETGETLAAYKKTFGSSLRDYRNSGAIPQMFVAFKGRDAALLIPYMTRHCLKFILYELGEKAGLKHLNTELLRHYAVSYLIGQGKSPDEIMKHLGLRRMGNIAKHLNDQSQNKLDTSAN